MTKNLFFHKKKSETEKSSETIENTNLYASSMFQTFSLGTGLRQLGKTNLGEIPLFSGKNIGSPGQIKMSACKRLVFYMIFGHIKGPFFLYEVWIRIYRHTPSQPPPEPIDISCERVASLWTEIMIGTWYNHGIISYVTVPFHMGLMGHGHHEPSGPKNKAKRNAARKKKRDAN